MARIVLSHVSKTYPDGSGGVHDVSLTIHDGEFVILVGPSGCGKTTTLNMIAGLESISSGDILIDDVKVNDVRPQDRDIAMVFQSYALYPHMSVRRNIAFPLMLRKMPKAQIAEKVTQVAQILDLTAVLDCKPSQLSGGQRQRVAMGRAIVRHPKAFLMDEPLSNLDAKLRVQMRAEIARLQRQLAITTIYVTHDQTEAMTLGDRVVVMNAGTIQQIGTPTQLYHEPHNLFVAGFIGAPAMNFLPGTLQGDHLRLPCGTVELPERHRQYLHHHEHGQDVICGIRPEHFRLGHLSGFECEIETEVDLVESLGADQYIYFSRINSYRDGDHTSWVARISSEENLSRGQRIILTFHPDCLVLFDAHTTMNLTLMDSCH